MSLFFAKNFRYSEIMCPCGCKKNKPIEPQLTYLLQALRDKIDRPIYISIGGGIRCKKYNKQIGGYIDSPHLYGKAVDIYSEAIDIIGLAQQAKAIGFNRVGLYPYNHFIHVDTVLPYPSESWVRDIDGKYKYFDDLEYSILFIRENCKEKSNENV